MANVTQDDMPQSAPCMGRANTDTGPAAATRFVRAADFTAARAWGALSIATIDGVGVRLHWTDQPYRWHCNDGDEVFVVVDGVVDMKFRESGREQTKRMRPGEIFFAAAGVEHRAVPVGPARVLVIERAGSTSSGTASARRELRAAARVGVARSTSR